MRGLVLLGLAWSLALPSLASAETPRRALRVLTVGNSFANDITHFFPPLTLAAEVDLTLFRANLGGATFERHATHLRAALADPESAAARPYRQTDPTTGEARNFSLPEALALAPWDVVTIQQVSHLSHRLETFEPHATEVIEAVRRLASGAEIVVHQIWAYRDDHAFFRGELTPEAMHQNVRRTYHEFARSRGLRVLPVGDAFHLARQEERWTYQPDPEFDYAQPPAGRLPNEKSGLHVGWSWRMVEGLRAFRLDGFHANDAGRYLGACVLFGFLLPDMEVPSAFRPGTLSEEDAADLRLHARRALETSSQ